MDSASTRKDGCADLRPPSRLAPRPKDGRPRLLLLATTRRGRGPWPPQVGTPAGWTALRELCLAAGIVPTVAVDHALAADGRASEDLVRAVQAGEARLGAHLIPALTPPLDGRQPAPFPGNLPRDVERAKLETLMERLEGRFGVLPRVYLAAGGGTGASSAALLSKVGLRVDVSPIPPVDLSDQAGPNYAHFPRVPFVYPAVSDVLAVPRSAARIGPLAGGSLAALDGWWVRAGLGALRRLDPERSSGAALARLARHLLADGVPVLTTTVHLESLTGPRGDEVRRSLADWFAAAASLGLVPSTHEELWDEVGHLPEVEGPYARSRRARN